MQARCQLKSGLSVLATLVLFARPAGPALCCPIVLRESISEADPAG